MTRVFPIAAVLVAIGVAAAPERADVFVAREARQAQDWHWAGSLAAGKTIEVKGVNGEVRATRAAGARVEVTASKVAGRKGDPEEVTIEVVEHDDGVTICAVYPSHREPNECRPGSGGRMNTRDNDTQVHFTVQVPPGVDFVGKTVNGDVEALGLGSNARVGTVNGDVEVSTSGLAEASTVNGSVRAEVGRADWTGELEFHTVNGSITVALPSSIAAEVTAKTVNGGIESDFPLTIRGRFGPREMRGTIGGGGRQLSLETVNGSIRLRSSGGR
jgi:hypothetical protein